MTAVQMRSKIVLYLLVAVLLISPSLSGGDDPGRDVTPSSTFRAGTRSALSDRFAEMVDYSDVMVIRNLNSQTSMDIADYFTNQRGIPWERVCNVTIAPTEVINRLTFADLRTQVEDFMVTNGLVDTINYIVTTKGVPLKVSDSSLSRASVDSELALINDNYSGSIGNESSVPSPYFNVSAPFSHADYHFYIVTRLTAYTKEEAMGLIDKATLAIGRKGTFLLDTDPRKGGGYEKGNKWMINADYILQQKGFNVILDQTNDFLTNYSNIAGYASWGSNDGSWSWAENLNAGFEADDDFDGVPDNWFIEDVSGTANVSRNSTDVRSGNWSVEITRPTADNEHTTVVQNFTAEPDRRYFIRGYANLSGVSAGHGVFLQIRILNDAGFPVAVMNGSARTGTTANYVSLGQVKLEPRNESNIQIAAVFSKSSGTVVFDDVMLIDVKPHNQWIPGALAETYVSTGGRSFTYGTSYGQSLVADLLRDGVTGLKGYVYEPYLSACAHPDILFKAYTEGYTLAESFSMASEYSLSWMDVIIGDPKLAPYNASYLPDLSLNDSSVWLDPSPAMMKDWIDIVADVSNLGEYPATDVTVSFYEGDPRSGGTLLENRSLDVLHGSVNTTSVTLQIANLTLGEHQFCAHVDSPDEYLETDESNNIACANITLVSVHLNAGWNLVSIPYVGTNRSVEAVLDSIDGKYDTIRHYNSSVIADPWKTFKAGRDPSLNELRWITNEMGFWIHMKTEADIVVGAEELPTTWVRLKYGWNLVGYPSFSDRTIQDSLAGVPWTRIEGFDPLATPHHLKVLSPTDVLSPGTAIWIKVTQDCWWLVDG
ncbi:MAG: TIGR03790 family protein [Thermoplasmata archaeon]|nr:TIGR03790 family protein [Thermoplasmata archaeon]